MLCPGGGSSRSRVKGSRVPVSPGSNGFRVRGSRVQWIQGLVCKGLVDLGVQRWEGCIFTSHRGNSFNFTRNFCGT